MNRKNILIYLTFVILLIIVSCLSQTELDGVWGYGFSYNIASGLIPYKDFNMVVGPLYSIIFSIFIKIFGNYFLAFSIQSALIYGLIILPIYKKIGWKSIYIILLLGCCLTTFGYNTFCAMLVLLIMCIEDSDYKYKTILTGILIGTIIMTKHNIGICLLLVYLLINYKKKLQVLSVLIPIIPTIIYLIVNNAFYSYIDFCYLGLGSFLDNLYVDIFTIPIIIYVIYFIIKNYRINKDKIILYLLVFQVMVFPIFDQGHILPALIPFTYYIFTKNKYTKLKFYLSYFIIIGISVNTISNLVLTKVYMNNDYLFLQRVKTETITYLDNYSKYLDKNKDKKIYLLLDNAYLIKIYRNENPTFYDLINMGNLGSNEQKYIDNMSKECANKKCMFILDKRYFVKKLYGEQRSETFKKYTINNANYLETLPSGDRVYVNYVNE